jgi:hypothetical protein
MTKIYYDKWEGGIKVSDGLPEIAKAEYPSKEEILKTIFDAVYAQYPKKEWQGLTDDEIQSIRIKTFDAVATNYEAYRAIEQALKEKNT